jgi:3'-phosphoadenosine 5'-phosphosulfate sulfotransferase (PAPS reductase)/FAD synthetase
MKYVCVSGGADSTALALLLWLRGEDFEMVFADTGAELPEIYWFLPRLAQTVQKPLRVVSNGSFYQHLVTYGYLLPGPRLRWCTRLLKQVPQDKFFQTVGADTVYIGIRADEPRRLHTNLKPRTGIHEFRYPLAEAGMGKKDVKALCSKYDLLNPVYKWRSNVSCFCCFFQRASDWKGLLKHHPTLFSLAEEWERQAMRCTEKGYTWRRGWTLEALRKTDEQQMILWPEQEEEPCLICMI